MNRLRLAVATIILASVLVFSACDIDLLTPEDPSYESECVFGIVPGERLDLHRSTFERCDPIQIYVVIFEGGDK